MLLTKSVFRLDIKLTLMAFLFFAPMFSVFAACTSTTAQQCRVCAPININSPCNQPAVRGPVSCVSHGTPRPTRYTCTATCTCCNQSIPNASCEGFCGIICVECEPLCGNCDHITTSQPNNCVSEQRWRLGNCLANESVCFTSGFSGTNDRGQFDHACH